jgi:hypothetical protein
LGLGSGRNCRGYLEHDGNISLGTGGGEAEEEREERMDRGEGTGAVRRTERGSK